jgi:aspartyl aminopeptidase
MSGTGCWHSRFVYRRIPVTQSIRTIPAGTIQSTSHSGPLLKINANQRYATDGRGAALWRRICRSAGIGTQEFVSNNAMPCGSTIGPLTATRLGIATVDVGIPLLSMHSARELAGTEDPLALTRAMEVFLAAED